MFNCSRKKHKEIFLVKHKKRNTKTQKRTKDATGNNRNKKLTISKQGRQIKRNIKTENGKERGYKKILRM